MRRAVNFEWNERNLLLSVFSKTLARASSLLQ